MSKQRKEPTRRYRKCQHRKRPTETPSQDGSPTGPRPAERKPWKKKTPVEVVLEQADKLKAEIAETEEELKAKRRQLEKFEAGQKAVRGELKPWSF